MPDLWNSPEILQTSPSSPQTFSSLAKRYPYSPNILLKFLKCSKSPDISPQIPKELLFSPLQAVANYLPGSPNVGLRQLLAIVRKVVGKNLKLANSYKEILGN